MYDVVVLSGLQLKSLSTTTVQSTRFSIKVQVGGVYPHFNHNNDQTRPTLLDVKPTFRTPAVPFLELP